MRSSGWVGLLLLLCVSGVWGGSFDKRRADMSWAGDHARPSDALPKVIVNLDNARKYGDNTMDNPPPSERAPLSKGPPPSTRMFIGSGMSSSLSGEIVDGKLGAHRGENVQTIDYAVNAIKGMSLADLEKVDEGPKEVGACCKRVAGEKNTEVCATWPKKKANYCFGATGMDCTGIPGQNNPMVKAFLPKAAVPLRRPVTHSTPARPYAWMVVSVGSIFHDTCCRKHPQGVFCNPLNQPMLSVLERSMNNCPCAKEWRKAVWNLIRGRVWLEKFPVPLSNDAEDAFDEKDNPKWGVFTGPQVDFALRPMRPSRMPLSLYDSEPEPSDHGLMENAEIARLSAPNGTPLDCPVEDSNCAPICDKAQGACKNSQTGEVIPGCTCTATVRLVEFIFAPPYLIAGDSNFCKSGTFSTIHVVQRGLYKQRYGVCAPEKKGEPIVDIDQYCEIESKEPETQTCATEKCMLNALKASGVCARRDYKVAEEKDWLVDKTDAMAVLSDDISPRATVAAPLEVAKQRVEQYINIAKDELPNFLKHLRSRLSAINSFGQRIVSFAKHVRSRVRQAGQTQKDKDEQDVLNTIT